MATDHHMPTCPVIHGTPDGNLVEGFPMYSRKFAADPHKIYRRMREEYGAIAPVELSPGVNAMLVLGYNVAREILHDPNDRFTSDPRAWQEKLPPDCEIRSMVEWRPNALRNSGDLHARYRKPTVEAINAIDLHGLRRKTEQAAISAINTFCQEQKAELITQYAFPVFSAVLNDMIGCPSDLGATLAAAFAAMFEGGDTHHINATMAAALSELVDRKRKEPRDDIATRLSTHPHRLHDEELANSILTFYGAGIEPGVNLIVNTLRLILTDDRFAGNILDGSLSFDSAIDEVLMHDPPLANYCIVFPRRSLLLEGVWLPAHEPVVISMAACNTDPAVTTSNPFGANRSHLAFSAGRHACPARIAACVITEAAIAQLLDALPDMALGCAPEELEWRPGPFHRALAALPVTFNPAPPLHQ